MVAPCLRNQQESTPNGLLNDGMLEADTCHSCSVSRDVSLRCIPEQIWEVPAEYTSSVVVKAGHGVHPGAMPFDE
jgi:hypothetical protein